MLEKRDFSLEVKSLRLMGEGRWEGGVVVVVVAGGGDY